ncbi:UNVERIFIED_CONTAM: hypothetical protein HDU68_011037 [Siphonaria sp. JEL0065]|nr:hypothetical protein HDU68_011037 [Siphonaria sp. JEL0065]
MSTAQCGNSNSVSSAPVIIIGTSGNSAPAGGVDVVARPATTTAVPNSVKPATPSEDSTSSSSGSGVGIAIGVVAVLVLVGVGAVMLMRRRAKAKREAAMQRHLELYPQHPRQVPLSFETNDLPPPPPPKHESPQLQQSPPIEVQPLPSAAIQQPVQRLNSIAASYPLRTRENSVKSSRVAPPVSLSVLERAPSVQSINSSKSVQSFRVVPEGSLVSTQEARPTIIEDLQSVYLQPSPQPIAAEMYSVAQQQQQFQQQQAFYAQPQYTQAPVHYGQQPGFTHQPYPPPGAFTQPNPVYPVAYGNSTPHQQQQPQQQQQQQQQYASYFGNAFGSNS